VSWLTSLLSLGAGVITATGAFLGVRLTVKQQERITRQSQWWRQFEHASQLALDEHVHKRTVGLRMLKGLAESDIAGIDELRMLDAFHRRLVVEDEEPSARAKGDPSDA
jgi:hypothetical protein